MPTENRSSNAEMVSELLPCPFCGQQDFLIERLDSDASVVICQGLTGPHEACLARGPVGVAQDEGEEQPGRDKAVELWNARAEQHQGEPIGYVCPRALDAAINSRIGAEQISILKTPYLYINKPLYAHPAPADPGEVERLRAEVERLRNGFYQQVTDDDLKKIADFIGDGDLPTKSFFLRPDAANLANVTMHMVREVQAARAQMAERDALLSDIKDEGATWPLRKSLVSRLETVLANGVARRASAEQSAPVERDERAAFERGDIVRKKSGAAWEGKIVGRYSTALTPDGYCVESLAHPGLVQIYPAAALERKP